MKHITVGVAGHIDHGKTALVRALTGTETDRLAEERERGMSIVLGFAHLGFPEGEVDLIDVPGHEKFVRTMISGATGIEAVLLVIAANERIKPQTVEHLALTELLGVKHGVVVITKSDLAEPDLRPLVAEEIREFLQETFLRDAPLLWTSSLTQEGLPELQLALRSLLAQSAEPARQPYFYLPVDRVFTMTGHGAVVTGTLRCGPLRIGKPVEVVSRGLRAEVRGLQVHNQDVEMVPPGWRTAVNLRGLKKEDIERGDALATPGFLCATRLLDVELTVLASASKPLRRGQTVLLYYGTAERQARVYPLDRDAILPGETAFAQFRLSADSAVPNRQPFILRTYSPAETIGGGTIVDKQPQKHSRYDADVLRRVRTLAHGSLNEMLLEKLLEAGTLGIEITRFSMDWGRSAGDVDLALSTLPAVRCGDLALHASVFEHLCGEAVELVSRFHEAHRTRPGMPREELRRKVQEKLPSVVFQHVIEELVQSGKLEAVDGVIRKAGCSPESMLTPIERQIAQELEACFRQAGLKPPNLKDVLGADRRRKNLFHFLLRTGPLIETTDRTSNRTVVFHRDAIVEAERLLERSLPPGTSLTVSELNTVLSTTRKYSVPLLEYFDSLGVTKRVGDLRGWNHEGG